MQGRAAGNPMAAMGRERSGVPKGTDMAEEGRDSACRGNRTWQRRAETRRAEETGHGGGGQQKRTGRRYAVRQQCFRGEYFGRDIVEGIPLPIFIVAFEPEQIGVLLPADIELREPIHP